MFEKTREDGKTKLKINAFAILFDKLFVMRKLMCKKIIIVFL